MELGVNCYLLITLAIFIILGLFAISGILVKYRKRIETLESGFEKEKELWRNQSKIVNDIFDEEKKINDILDSFQTDISEAFGELKEVVAKNNKTIQQIERSNLARAYRLT